MSACGFSVITCRRISCVQSEDSIGSWKTSKPAVSIAATFWTSGRATGAGVEGFCTSIRAASGLIVEPRPACVPALEQFCLEHPNWSFVTAGVGASEGELPLALRDTSSTLLKDSVALAKETVSVPVVRCDSLFGANAIYPNLVKLDVEGFEMEVLSGAALLFGRVDLFVIEVATFPFGTTRPLAHEVIAFLEGMGYLLYDVGGFIRRPYDGAVGLLDLVFARQGCSLTDHPNEWFAKKK